MTTPKATAAELAERLIAYRKGIRQGHDGYHGCDCITDAAAELVRLAEQERLLRRLTEWHDGTQWFAHDASIMPRNEDVTHWMPLPAPPLPDSEKDRA